MDAFGAPFVQGRLTSEPLSVTATTECAHCAEPLHLEIDSELRYRVEETGAEPLVFAPLVNFSRVREQSIVDVF